MSWERAQAAWNRFLNEVDGKRKEIHCSLSNAWFRGQDNHEWHLTTSLFRYEHRVDADTKKRLARISCEIDESKKNVAQCERRVSQAKRNLGEARKAGKKGRDESSEYEAKSAQFDRWKRELQILTHRRKVLESVHYGEREAYIEFCLRAGRSHSSSWEVLAEMQHYRTPTRLLDWTEVLAIAVYFSLKNYIRDLLNQWEPAPGKGLIISRSNETALGFFIPPDLPTPRIWILNPYRLSRLAWKENSLCDPTKEKGFDYFENFFVNFDWEHELPLPIYVPWKERRIAAQRAMFTVQGLDVRPLDIQLPVDNDALRWVDLSPDAAVYGVKHLMDFLGLNAHAIFQDLDSLGSEITRRFIIPNSRD